MLYVQAAVVYLSGSYSLQIRYSPAQQTGQLTALYTDMLWCRSISSLLDLIVSTLLVDLFHEKSSLRHHQLQAATFVSGLSRCGDELNLIKVQLEYQIVLAMPQRQRNARHGIATAHKARHRTAKHRL